MKIIQIATTRSDSNEGDSLFILTEQGEIFRLLNSTSREMKSANWQRVPLPIEASNWVPFSDHDCHPQKSDD